MAVTPIQLTAPPADKPATGAARAGNPSASQFADVLSGTRNAANGSRGPSVDGARTTTSTGTAKLAPDAGETPRAGKQPLAADAQDAGNKSHDDAAGLVALTLPVHLAGIAEVHSATEANAESGNRHAALPSQTQTSDTSRLLKLAGGAALNAPGQQPAAEPADAVAQRVAARLIGEARDQAAPHARLKATTPDRDTTTAATSAKRIDALFPTTTAAPTADAGQIAVGAAANPNVLRRALDAIAAGVAQKTERTASSKTDSAVLPAHSPAMHASAPSPGAPATAPLPQAPAVLNQPVGDPNWNQALAQQSLRLHHAGAGRAELQLHPKDLGTLQISLQMGEQAQMHISSPHAHVRAAVENALPQLRQAFADSGIALGDTSVGDQSARQGQGFDQDRRPARPPSPDAIPRVTGAAVGETAITVLSGSPRASGIDLYA